MLDDEPLTGTQLQSATPDAVDTGAGTLQSQLGPDIEVARSLLQDSSVSNSHPFGALSALSEACAAVWHEVGDFDRAGQAIYLFEDQTPSWVDAFVATLQRGEPIALHAAPDNVLTALRACRPHQVRPRTWLVMYYSIILSMMSSTEPANKDSKAKIKCNLWLALNDVRVLLEPSDANIQALILLASHVEEFTTPSLCWMLVSSACRMLQALGVSLRSMDAATRHRRRMMFWHLNIVDKGLAMIFGRPPTFHRTMARTISLPTVAELIPEGSRGTPGSLFGAHFFHQVMQLSLIMGDIWAAVYDSDSPDEHIVQKARADLIGWYAKAKTLLQAAAAAESPPLSREASASLQLGLLTTDFYHYYMLILLARNSLSMKPEIISASLSMLRILPALVSDSEEIYNGIVWMLICSPFTAFLKLFGEVISSQGVKREEDAEAIEAMEILPVSLAKMGIRNSLATKLESVAAVLVKHAKDVAARKTYGSRQVIDASLLEKPEAVTAVGPVYSFEDMGVDFLCPGNDGIFDVDWLNFGEATGDWNELEDWQAPSAASQFGSKME